MTFTVNYLLLTCSSSTPVSVDWAFSSLLDKINRIAGFKRKEIKVNGRLCVSLDCAAFGPLIGTMASSLRKHFLDTDFARARGIIFRFCSSSPLTVRSVNLCFCPPWRGRGAGLKQPPQATGSVTWKFAKSAYQGLFPGSHFSASTVTK